MPPHCHLALLVESVAPADALLLIARVLLGKLTGRVREQLGHLGTVLMITRPSDVRHALADSTRNA